MLTPAQIEITAGIALLILPSLLAAVVLESNRRLGKQIEAARSQLFDEAHATLALFTLFINNVTLEVVDTPDSVEEDFSQLELPEPASEMQVESLQAFIEELERVEKTKPVKKTKRDSKGRFSPKKKR